MIEATSEMERECAEEGLDGERGTLRPIAKSPPQELRRLVIAAASSLPSGRNWWAKRPVTPGAVVRA